MRRKMVVANRRMNGSIPENESFMRDLLTGTRDFNNADFVVCLPHPFHYQAKSMLSNTPIAWVDKT